MSKFKTIFAPVLLMLVSILSIQGFSSCTSKEARLEKAVSQLNARLPMKLSKEFTMQKIALDGNALVYEIKCNEHFIDMDLIEQNKDELKQNSLAQLKSELKSNKDFASLLDYCKEKDINVVYRYKGSSSKKAVDIVISPSEI